MKIWLSRVVPSFLMFSFPPPMHYIGRDVFDHSNTLRPLVISRKNMQFYGNHEAAENTAIICSLLGSCKERGVNPREWLNDVISKLPYYLAPKSDRDLKELLPDVWRK